ncbi:hypothetical protein C8Q80DRAFT_113173 [Daedaleopsis nitida]|nr:hypothetical protein C8Q80DRAFT_113173 [Daedaleopsis nitida]
MHVPRVPWALPVPLHPPIRIMIESEPGWPDELQCRAALPLRTYIHMYATRTIHPQAPSRSHEEHLISLAHSRLSLGARYSYARTASPLRLLLSFIKFIFISASPSACVSIQRIRTCTAQDSAVPVRIRSTGYMSDVQPPHSTPGFPIDMYHLPSRNRPSRIDRHRRVYRHDPPDLSPSISHLPALKYSSSRVKKPFISHPGVPE